jgi:hypothetical protein
MGAVWGLQYVEEHYIEVWLYLALQACVFYFFSEDPS